jgi:hypothetical protein
MLFLVNDQGTPSMAEWIQATTNIMLPGDFNDDHVVNAADYTVWRNGLGSNYTEADYGVWKDHFGETDGTGAGSAGTISSLSVPEPAALASLMIGLAAAAAGRRRRKRGSYR